MTGKVGMRWAKTEVRKVARETKAYWKNYFAQKAKVPMSERLKESIFKMLEKVDPIEALAIIGSTVVVHEVIFKLDEFSKSLEGIQWAKIAQLGLQPSNIISDSIMSALNALMGKSQGSESTMPSPSAITLTEDLWLWLIAFAISYFTVRHGGELLAVSKSFFGLGAVAT